MAPLHLVCHSPSILLPIQTSPNTVSLAALALARLIVALNVKLVPYLILEYKLKVAYTIFLLAFLSIKLPGYPSHQPLATYSNLPM
jgi:hypothetical protein